MPQIMCPFAPPLGLIPIIGKPPKGGAKKGPGSFTLGINLANLILSPGNYLIEFLGLYPPTHSLNGPILPFWELVPFFPWLNLYLLLYGYHFFNLKAFTEMQIPNGDTRNLVQPWNC